jgi:hypothetical protein
MFYTRINKIKVFNNREGFLGLFNRAELRIYSYVGAGLAPALIPNGTDTNGTDVNRAGARPVVFGRKKLTFFKY